MATRPRGFGRGRGKRIKDPNAPPGTLFSTPPPLSKSEIDQNLERINNLQSSYTAQPSHFTSPNARATNGNSSSSYGNRDNSSSYGNRDNSSSYGNRDNSHNIANGWGNPNAHMDRFSDPANYPPQDTSDCSETIRVQCHRVGRIIGSRGATINSIQDQSGAKIDIARDEIGDEKEVTITGSRDSVTKARELISEILGDESGGGGRSSSGRPTNNDPSGGSEVIRVAENSVGRIIGKSGATINEIRDESGATIDIGKESSGYEKEVTLRGSPAAIAKARDLISNIVAIIDDEEPRSTGVIDYNKTIDWGQIAANEEAYRFEKWGSLPPVQKKFYTEDPQISSLSEAEVLEIRANNMAIEVSHYVREQDKDNPAAYPPIAKPILTFEHCFQRYPDILKEIYKQGFKEPSPIQKQMWPVLLSGHDCIGVAQTGTGKTLAFLLPAFIHIEAQPKPRSQRKGPTVFCLAPTRELALQIKWEVSDRLCSFIPVLFLHFLA